MVSALDSRLSGPDFEPWPGHCIMFLGKTLNILIVPLFTQVYK